MPVNFKRTCGWSRHAVQRKQTTCWDLAFCKQNNEKHNHGRRQGQGPATKERQLISDSVVTVLQIGIFHNYIVESRGKSLRLKIIFSLRHRRLSSSGRCCLVRTKKHFFGKTQNFKAEIDTFPQFSSSLLSQLKVHSHCHDGRAEDFWLSPSTHLWIQFGQAAEKTELKWESCLVSRCTVISLHQPLTCAWIWPASSTHDFQGIFF